MTRDKKIHTTKSEQFHWSEHFFFIPTCKHLQWPLYITSRDVCLYLSMETFLCRSLVVVTYFSIKYAKMEFRKKYVGSLEGVEFRKRYVGSLGGVEFKENKLYVGLSLIVKYSNKIHSVFGERCISMNIPPRKEEGYHTYPFRVEGTICLVIGVRTLRILCLVINICFAS